MGNDGSNSMKNNDFSNSPRMKTILWSVFLLLIGVLNGCNKDDFSEDVPKGPNPKKILELVNNYRQTGCNCGSKYFPPTNMVAWNDLLKNAAQKHSNDMKENNFFDHTGSDGSNPGDRISNAGYIWSIYGENIAKGYKSENDVVNGWIKSEGHCKNIMNPNFKEMGVANNGTYWTQVFGKQ